MHLRFRLLVALLPALASGMPAAAQELGFHILKDRTVVGSIKAIRRDAGHSTIYVVSSYSQMAVVKKQMVRSNLATEYRQGSPYSCFSSFHLNGALRDSSYMCMQGNLLSCYRYPDERFEVDRTSAWTTSRMYFEEPAGQSTVFVESVLQECRLRSTAAGVYVLELPGNRTNTYRYTGGKLMEVQVDQPLLKLTFRRA